MICVSTSFMIIRTSSASQGLLAAEIAQALAASALSSGRPSSMEPKALPSMFRVSAPRMLTFTPQSMAREAMRGS